MSSRSLRDLAGAVPRAAAHARQRHSPARPMLRFTPYAWAKLLFLRDAGQTEVGGFAISAPQDCLLIEDVRLVRQNCTRVSVEFADEAVADFFDEQVDLGRRPEQFARMWVHTHPGDSPHPTRVDEETFARAFGRADWAVMFILARGGPTYARLQFGCGPGASLRIPVHLEYAAPFPASDRQLWQQEYAACVQPRALSPRPAANILPPARADQGHAQDADDFFQFPEDVESDLLGKYGTARAAQ